MLHAFIDPSVLLRFYSYSDDTLTEVEKISALVKSNAIKLYITDQVIDERARNRDKELSESLKRIDQMTAPVQIPRFAEHHKEAKEYIDALKLAREAKKKLVTAIQKEISAGELRADRVIQELFEASIPLTRTIEIIEKARLRKELGNPPGKRDSLGDQINWEMLLDHVPAGVPLHMVVRDGDYKGVIEETANFFLKSEWHLKKKADLNLYSGLSEFAKVHFPDIKVPSDAVKSAAIKELISSGSYQSTHKQIAILETIFDALTLADAIMLFQAFIQNGQINTIQTDKDVVNFYGKLYGKFCTQLDGDLEGKLWEVEHEDASLFIPF